MPTLASTDGRLRHLPQTHGPGMPPSVRAQDVFGHPPHGKSFPLNRITTAHAVRDVPFDRLEPRQSHIPVAGLAAYLDKPRRGVPDVVRVTLPDGADRFLIQEGHTRLGAAKLGGRTRPARVWQFVLNPATGEFEPVPRGLHNQGLAKIHLGGAGSGNFGHAGRPGEVGGSGAGDGSLSDDIDNATSVADVQRALDTAHATPLRAGGQTIPGVFVTDNHVIEWDGKDEYPSVSEKDEWVNQAKPEEYYPDYEDQFNKDFWESGGEVYHATTEENADDIEKDGIEGRSQTRGMSNRHEGAAVYTTTDIEDTEMEDYGSEVFAIDVAAMKRDGLTPYASREPDVVEGELRGALASAVGLDNYEYDYEHGMSPNTVAIAGHIPAKYVRRAFGRKLSSTPIKVLLTGRRFAALNLGGPGSGNFGHAGRHGEVGGSAPDEDSGEWTGTTDDSIPGLSPKASAIVRAIEDSNVGSDYVHELYGSDPDEMVAAEFNIEGVKDSDFEQAKAHIKRVSQDMLRRIDGDELTVYRGMTGNEGRNNPGTTTLTRSEQTAKSHADMHARKGKPMRQFGEPFLGTVKKFRIKTSDVLSYSEAIGRGVYAEEEIIVPRSVLKDLSYREKLALLLGGEGSGNFGHVGRPGEVGGSGGGWSGGDGRVTGTPAFKDWFGQSKVVTGKGRPMVLYHGTKTDIAEFRRGTDAAAGRGIYFAQNPDKANSFAGVPTTDGGETEIGKWMRERGMKRTPPKPGGNVLPVYVKIENPYRVDIYDSKSLHYAKSGQAERDGHDGLFIPAVGEWVAFKPEQVKSAIGNKGTFDPKNPNISLGGEGSGNFGHAGRPGEVGGSGGGVSARMAALKDKYPVVATNFARDSGTEMGSIEKHTKDVGREWAKQLTPEELDDISTRFGSDVNALMATAIPLHDIGKPDALEEGDKSRSAAHTVPILQDVLRQEGFKDKDIALATELINHDLIGPLLRGYEGVHSSRTPQQVADTLESKAKKVGMDASDFAKLQLAFFQADASAYPYVTRFMTKEAGGKWAFKGKKVLEPIEALANRPKRKDLGGEGSGNFGHAGRPGEVGGSGEGGTVLPNLRTDRKNDTLTSDVGYIALRPTRSGKGFMVVDDVLVWDQFRGQGWGPRLYAAAAGYAASKGYDGIARSNVESYDAVGVWHRMAEMRGFRVEDRTVNGKSTQVLLPTRERFALGGEGSGNFGHVGRPGEVGGSGPGDGRADDALDAVADLAVSDEMQELEEAWAGGVADFGDEMAAQAIQNAPGYEDYQKDISDTLRQKLGDSITVYRSVTPDEHDDWTAGGGPQGIVGVTLDPEVAQKWEKFAGNKAGRKVITFPIDPARVIMRGKREESEIVVDADYVSQSEVKSLGGVGSGNFGHLGRPGEVGGSGPGGESDVQEDGTLRPGVLKDEPSRYFHIDDQTEMVPIAKLRTIRARPEGIAHAEPLMRKAYEGVGGKRKPVSLEKQADGTYAVLDGNSTTAIARKHGWDKIPAHVTHAQGDELTAAAVGDILAEQHEHVQARAQEREAGALANTTRFEAPFLRDKFVASDTFRKMEIPIDAVSPIGHVKPGAKSHSTGPIVVDANKASFGRGMYGAPPRVVVLDGKHRLAEAKASGQKTITAYVGEKATAHIPHAQTLSYRAKLAMLLGGEGSGNFGHAGRPGEVGGSGPGEGQPAKPVAITARLAEHPGMEMVAVSELEKFRTQDRRVENKSAMNITEPTESLLPRLTRELREGAAIRQPLEFAYDTEDGRAILIDGNTRLAAIADAGFTHAPVIISRQNLHGFGRPAPKLSSAQAGVEPYRNWLLPSEAGLTTLKSAKKDLRHDLGGEGSGNFGHEGRPGEVGGSGPGSGHSPGTLTHAGDESGSGMPTPGKPFIVYRLGKKDGELENANAGNADSVASHLSDIDDWERPQSASGHGDTVTAYEVVVEEPFGRYEAKVAGKEAYGHKPTGSTAVGRTQISYGHVAKSYVAYSFPKGGKWTAKPVGSVPLTTLRERLKAKVGADAFDDDRANAATPALIREAFTDRAKSLADVFDLGGEGSGNFGHEGRPGEVGGSGPGGGHSENRQRFEQRWPMGPELDAFEAKRGRDWLENDLKNFWSVQNRGRGVNPTEQFHNEVIVPGNKRLSKERSAAKRAAKAENKPRIIEQMVQKYGYTVGDTVFDTEHGTKGIIKWGRDGQPFVESAMGKHYVGSRWKKASKDLSFVERLRLTFQNRNHTIDAVDLGGAGSGNFGHAGRPGEVGGSAAGDGGGGGVAYREHPDPHEFIAARDKSTRKGFLSALTAEDLKDQKLYLSEDGTVGGALTKDGDMGQLFNNDGPKGAAREVLINMIKDGGKTADAFDIFLPELYANFGLQETGRMKFNPEYAPKGWNYPRDNHPDVVFLARTTESAEEAGSADDIRERTKDRSKWIAPRKTGRYYADDQYDQAKRDALARADAGRTRSLGTFRENSWSGLGREARRGGAGGSASVGRSLTYRDKLTFLLGGAGSGNFGHAGRPGEVGGSSSEGGAGGTRVPGKGPAHDELIDRQDREHDAYMAFEAAKEAHADASREMERKYGDDYEKWTDPAYLDAQKTAQAAKTKWDDAQKAVLEQRPEARKETVQAHVDIVADRLNYDPSKIDVVDKDPRPFEVAGRQLNEGGHFSPQTGRIEVNARNADESVFWQGLVAHEIMHAQQDTIEKRVRSEHDEINKLIDQSTRIVGGRGEVIKEPESKDYDRLFMKSGFPRDGKIPELEARFPVSAAMAKYGFQGDSYLGTWKQDDKGRWTHDYDEYRTRSDRMEKEDGFTAYSKLYWEATRNPSPTGQERRRAVQETLAEVAAYHDRASRGRWDEGVPSKSWQDYARAIQQASGVKLPSTDVAPKGSGNLSYREKLVVMLGGSGSGNFGHAGRPGEIGGSAPGTGGGEGKKPGTKPGAFTRARTGLDQNVERMIHELNHERAVPGGVTPASIAARSDANEAIQAVEGAKNPFQPIRPPAKTDNDAAFKVLSKETPKNQIPVSKVLDALGGNARAQFKELMKKGEEANPVMHAIADDIKAKLGGTSVVKTGDIKSLNRSVKKVVGKDGGDARNVRDVVRASIAVGHVDDLDDAVAAVHSAVKKAGGTIVTVTDRFRKPMATGYRDMNINVRMPNGIIGEIQVHLKSMLKAKDLGGGHELYEQIRTIGEREHHRPLTVAERTEIGRLNRQSHRLYQAAWKSGGGRSKQ